MTFTIDVKWLTDLQWHAQKNLSDKISHITQCDNSLIITILSPEYQHEKKTKKNNNCRLTWIPSLILHLWVINALDSFNDYNKKCLSHTMWQGYHTGQLEIRKVTLCTGFLKVLSLLGFNCSICFGVRIQYTFPLQQGNKWSNRE